MLRSSIRLLLLLTLVSTSSLAGAADKVEPNQKDVKTAQLKMQARIAAEQGDFSKALKNIEAAAQLQGDRTTANQARQLIPNIQGGASGFDPTELMELIQAQTTPPAQWIDVDGEGGVITPNFQGVYVAAPAILKAVSKITDDSNLMKAVQFVRNANHNVDVRTTSRLRMVSIVRLEAHVNNLISQGRAIPEDVKAIAGLSRIDYLLVYPATGDLVIAGPASDWSKSSDGRMVSTDNGRPTLVLDDLVTMNRAFSKGSAEFFMCTIDPKQAQVAAVQDYVNKNQNRLNRATAAKFTQQLEQKLGLQNVFVQGVPQSSRVASVIVDADYRMKEIGIGRRKGPAGMKSYFDLLTRSEQRGSGSMDALRWWMAVGYNAINMSSDGSVFEFDGTPIQCLAEDQIVGAAGTRTPTGKATRANAKFAELFTKHLPALADQDVVFADLENIFDLAMVSALINSHGLADQVGWTAEAFGRHGDYQIQEVAVPTELMTAAHHKVYSGGSIVIQVAGGVRGNVSELLNDRNKQVIRTELDMESTKATPLGQQNGRWWWDAR